METREGTAVVVFVLEGVMVVRDDEDVESKSKSSLSGEEAIALSSSDSEDERRWVSDSSLESRSHWKYPSMDIRIVVR